MINDVKLHKYTAQGLGRPWVVEWTDTDITCLSRLTFTTRGDAIDFVVTLSSMMEGDT